MRQHCIRTQGIEIDELDGEVDNLMFCTNRRMLAYTQGSSRRRLGERVKLGIKIKVETPGLCYGKTKVLNGTECKRLRRGAIKR